AELSCRSSASSRRLEDGTFPDLGACPSRPATARNSGSFVLMLEELLACPIHASIRLRRSPRCSFMGWGGSLSTSVHVAPRGAGGIVVNRAARADVTYAFIAFYAALVFGRSIYLGEPLTIPLHRLESGALLLFTFFMISDPKTTPDSRAGRLLFAALVAFGAW